MAIVRELTTLLDFKTDMSGLQVYEHGVERIKGLVLEAGKLFGLYFAVDKIGEYVKEIVNAGKEMVRINIQIAQIARSTDDAQVITNTLFETAQKLGVEYNDMAHTFREFLNDSQESTVSQEELLTATENIYKSLRVGRASAEEMGQALGAITRGLRLNRFGPRQIGLLLDIPGISRELVQASGMTREALRELGKSGKITGEQILSWLVKPNEQLNAEFDKMPVKIGIVFTRIRNQLAYAAMQVWKMTGGFSALGQVIWSAFNLASTAVKNFVRILGGLKSTFELLGIAIMLVVGPLVVRQIMTMSAAFVGLAIRSWAIWTPWIAIGAAVAGVAVAIQDLWYWFQGKPSLIGTWVGPFSEFKDQMKDVPILGQLLKVHDALGDTGTIVAAIGAAFALWNTPAFFGTLIRSLLGVKAAATEAAVAAGAAGTGGGTSAPAAAGAAGIGGGTSPAAAAVKPKAGAGPLTWLGRLSALTIPFLLGGDTPDTAEPKLSSEELKRTTDEINKQQGYSGNLWTDIMRLLSTVTGDAGVKSYNQAIPGGAPVPGAINNVTTSLTQNNNITVTTSDEAQLADLIERRVQNAAPELLDQVSRQITGALPRSERPTQ